MARAIASVIIAAHNEAQVIAQTVAALTSGVERGDLDIIVVCNGCTDATAERAMSAGGDCEVRVCSIDQASKAAALNIGDQLTSVFPRIYLDADVTVFGTTVLEVVDFLRSRKEAMAARPPLAYFTDNCDRLVRSYYRARSRTPSLMNAIWGAGFYAVNAAGRARWEKFPEDQADDILAASRFGQRHMSIVGSSPVLVYPPLSTRALLQTLGRVHDTVRITIEDSSVDESLPDCKAGWRPRPRATFGDVLTHNRRNVYQIIDALVYFVFATTARFRIRLIGRRSWERDETTRRVD